MKRKTIDEHCGGNSGSFKKFLKDKETFLNKLEEKRKVRIRSGRAARAMAWAA
jgi:hypothetical protein